MNRLARGLAITVVAMELAGRGISAASGDPAQIVRITPGGVGYVDVTTGSDGVSAQVGRWDTEYPNPDTGEAEPGLEPLGASTLEIEIDVRDGGTVSFGYRFLTYDAGIYDWLDILMVTPDGTEPIVANFGKPGSAYGSYWESAFIAITRSLDRWRGQRVSFVFSVQQDGWGDQSAARVTNFAVRSCSTPPLTTLTDEDALQFENGATVDTARLTSPMRSALSCLQQRTSATGGTLTVTSAYRPVAYQVHLREVWDRWKDLKNSRDPECTVLRSLIGAEFTKHALQLSQRPATTSAHTRGEAFDARWTPSELSIDTLAEACDLRRPLKETDPVHFVRR